MKIQQATRYPRNGQFAILCEGDLAGYEVDMLESWTAEFPDLGLVDVWPCGTKTAIYGVSDAIGRSIPLLVIEDRDHRTVERADKDCRGNLKDRTDRGVRMSAWRSWARSEIENYLVEPSVLFPVFSEVFSVSEDQLSTYLQEILRATACDQSLQMALSEARSAFPKGDKDVGGINRVKGRPIWRDAKIVTPDTDTVRSLFSTLLSESVARLAPDKLPKVDMFVSSFDTNLAAWTSMEIDDDEWKLNWAGKEVMAWLRKVLTSEIGWPDKSNPGTRQIIDWQSLNSNDAGEWDRKIERALQPRLVDEFLSQLKQRSLPQPVVDEWDSIVADIRVPTSSLT